MKSFVKIISAFVFSVILSIALILPTTVSAYSGIAVYGNQYRQYFQCTLKNYVKNRSKNGSITISMYPANSKIRNYSVRMVDERGKYIWEENGAISWNGTRTFHLGNDHKVYRIYIKSNGGSRNVATATVTGSSNVSIITK